MSVQSEKATFTRLLGDKLKPVLESNGFFGADLEYQRMANGIVACLWIQDRSDSKACCVNLGVDFQFLKGDKFPYKQVECDIKKRLAPEEESDYWWAYDSHLKGVLEIVDLFQSKALSFYSQYEPFPGILSDLTVNDISSNEYMHSLPGVTRGRAGLLLAQIHEQLENKGRAVEFAECALTHLNAMAVGPKKKLKQLIERNKL